MLTKLIHSQWSCRLSSLCLILLLGLLVSQQSAIGGGRACRWKDVLEGLDSRLIPEKLRPDVSAPGIIAAWQGGDRAITALAFVGNDGMLAVAERGADNREGTPGTLTFLNLSGAAPKVQSSERPTNDMLISLAACPDGHCLAGGGARWDRSLILWRETDKNWSQVRRLPLSSDWWLRAMQFSNDGSKLATATSDPSGPVQLWTVMERGETLERDQVLPGPAWSLSAIAFSPNGRLIAAGLGSAHHHPRDGRVLVWDVSQPSAELVADIPARQEGTAENYDVTAIRFSRDGQTLITGDQQGYIRTWSVADHGELTARSTFAAHTGTSGGVQSLARVATGDLISSGYDGTVKVWDTGTGRNIRKWSFGTGSTVLAAAPNLRHFAVGLANGAVYVLKVD